jgi:hypothetical protein
MLDQRKARNTDALKRNSVQAVAFLESSARQEGGVRPAADVENPAVPQAFGNERIRSICPLPSQEPLEQSMSSGDPGFAELYLRFGKSVELKSEVPKSVVRAAGEDEYSCGERDQ